MTAEQQKINAALALADGRYQRALILGHETWSGSSLRGRAKLYGSRYAASRRALLGRLERHRVGYLTIGERGRILLVLGAPPDGWVRCRVAAGSAWVPPQRPDTVLDNLVQKVFEEG